MSMRTPLHLLLAAGLALAVGCGGDDESATPAGEDTEATSTTRSGGAGDDDDDDDDGVEAGEDTEATSTTASDRDGDGDDDGVEAGEDDDAAEGGDGNEPSPEEIEAQQEADRAEARCLSLMSALGEARSSVTAAFSGGQADLDAVAEVFEGFDAPGSVDGALDQLAQAHRDLERIRTEAGVDFSDPEQLERPEAAQAVNEATAIITSPAYVDSLAAVEAFTSRGCA